MGERIEGELKEKLAQSIFSRAKNLIERDGEQFTGFVCAFYDAPTPYIKRPDAPSTFFLNLLFEKGISRIVITHRKAREEKRKKGLIRKKEIIIQHPEFTTVQIHTRVDRDIVDVFQLHFEENKMPTFYTYTDLYHKGIGSIPARTEQREVTLDNLEAFDWVMNNLMPAEPLKTPLPKT